MIAGATGPNAVVVDGTFDRVPGERRAGGAPVYRKRGRDDDAALWLYLAPSTNTWQVDDTEGKDARSTSGWAGTVAPVADGTLPHEAPAGGWQVSVGGGQGFIAQPAVTVTVDD